MIKAFADSFYLIAMINERDEFHARALEIGHTLAIPLVTTEYILVEVADALAKTQFRRRVGEFATLFQKSPYIEYVPAGDQLLQAGLLLYARRPDKHWTLTDCISFEVMRERGVTQALTQDHHFKQAGFHLLL